MKNYIVFCLVSVIGVSGWMYYDRQSRHEMVNLLYKDQKVSIDKKYNERKDYCQTLKGNQGQISNKTICEFYAVSDAWCEQANLVSKLQAEYRLEVPWHNKPCEDFIYKVPHPVGTWQWVINQTK